MFRFRPPLNSPLLAFNLSNRGVERREDNFQMKPPFVLFGFNVVAGLLWNIILCLLFSSSYVQFTHVFLFGLYLPLLTQSSLFLFSLCQTAALSLPLALLTYCRPCMAFLTEACLCSLFLYKDYGYPQAGAPGGKYIFLLTNKFIFIQEE